MEYPLYEEGGLPVEIYDQSCLDSGDVEFLIGLARRTGGPVLELACGTGRVVWPLAEAGFDVVGLDIARPMLRRAEEKGRASAARDRVRFVHANMADFELEERFGLVFSTFRSFQALLTPEKQRACLGCAHRHLKLGGLLMLDVFDPHLGRLEEGDVEPGWAPQTYRHPDSGNDVKVEAVDHHNDVVNQVLTEHWSLTEVDADGNALRREVRELSLRWTYRFELRYLLELCGFLVEAEYSDFKGSPPAYGKEQIWVARKL